VREKEKRKANNNKKQQVMIEKHIIECIVED